MYGFNDVAVEIDASFRDLLWVAYVNRSTARKLKRTSGAVTPPKSSGARGRRLKLSAFEMIGWACAPADLVLRLARIDTVGMRITAGKRLAAER
jgi:hypothetical protein